MWEILLTVQNLSGTTISVWCCSIAVYSWTYQIPVVPLVMNTALCCIPAPSDQHKINHSASQITIVDLPHLSSQLTSQQHAGVWLPPSVAGRLPLHQQHSDGCQLWWCPTDWPKHYLHHLPRFVSEVEEWEGEGRGGGKIMFMCTSLLKWLACHCSQYF